MEKRINKKIENYIVSFKDSLCKKITELNINEKKKINELIEYLYEFERLTLTPDDFLKRKRVKNAIPDINRCNAQRANGEQCTRRRKADSEFCGTHFKGIPHGIILEVNNSQSIKTIEIFAEEIKGIIYYIDNFGNVYKITDILTNKENPDKIGSYKKINNEYILDLKPSGFYS